MCTQQIKTFNPLNNEAQNYCKLNQSHKTFYFYIFVKIYETPLQTSKYKQGDALSIKRLVDWLQYFLSRFY